MAATAEPGVTAREQAVAGVAPGDADTDDQHQQQGGAQRPRVAAGEAGLRPAGAHRLEGGAHAGAVRLPQGLGGAVIGAARDAVLQGRQRPVLHAAGAFEPAAAGDLVGQPERQPGPVQRGEEGDCERSRARLWAQPGRSGSRSKKPTVANRPTTATLGQRAGQTASQARASRASQSRRSSGSA